MKWHLEEIDLAAKVGVRNLHPRRILPLDQPGETATHKAAKELVGAHKIADVINKRTGDLKTFLLGELKEVENRLGENTI